jgi:AcrR family transcriptional regulator
MAGQRLPGDAALTREQILRAAEDVLRRFGPAKATVLDVARVLGVSHGSVYRHFPSKTALREAVAERWLARAHAPLSAVAGVDAPAPWRLRQWLTTLFATKRAKALDDPELFATYLVLVQESSTVTDAHVSAMVGQIAQIIADGVAHGDFAVAGVTTVDGAARAVWDATRLFHDPTYASQWSDPGIAKAFEDVCTLVLNGLSARPDATGPARTGATGSGRAGAGGSGRPAAPAG